jgi:hypothetical protein
VPTQIASTYMDHSLTAAKGWFDMSALDFQAKFDAAITFLVPAGRCCFLYTAGATPKQCTVKTGLSNTSMPLFVWNGSNSTDVNNPGTTASGRFLHQAIGPTGVGQFLVASGGYELETTEFIAGTYTPNRLLTAVAADTNAVTGGMLTSVGTAAGGTLVKQFTDTVCGVVSRGQFVNSDKVPVIAFWPWFIPGTAPA